MSISLNAYMWRVENQEATPETGWRRMATGTDSPVLPGWRGRPAAPGH